MNVSTDTSRREFLTAIGAGLVAVTAGCVSRRSKAPLTATTNTLPVTQGKREYGFLPASDNEVRVPEGADVLAYRVLPRTPGTDVVMGPTRLNAPNTLDFKLVPYNGNSTTREQTALTANAGAEQYFLVNVQVGTAGLEINTKTDRLARIALSWDVPKDVEAASKVTDSSEWVQTRVYRQMSRKTPTVTLNGREYVPIRFANPQGLDVLYADPASLAVTYKHTTDARGVEKVEEFFTGTFYLPIIGTEAPKLPPQVQRELNQTPTATAVAPGN